MKSWLLTAACLVTAAFSSGPAAAQDVLRMNNYEPPAGVTNTQFYQPWVDRINAADPAALRIDYFPGGGLGRDPATQLDIVENRIADIAYVLSPYHAGRFPDNVVMNFPLLTDSVRDGSVAFSMLYEQGLLRGYDTVAPLGLHASPVAYINSVNPINRIEDLRGLRVRAPDGVIARMMEELGAVPVTNIAVSQAAENMSRGVIDASIDNVVSIRLFNHTEVAPNAFGIPFGQVITMIAINRDSYDGLSDAARAALDSGAFRNSAEMWGEVLGGLGQSIEADLRASPNYRWVDPSEADQEIVAAAAARVAERLFTDDPHIGRVYEALVENLNQIRSEN